ncbi:VWFA and cache domain-containing protein 1-like [Macrobrachium rosenbergii]|uniref:VWFA and cache domain-containing protein 1-like n=1 Tax=Macrobrachium rosenbergii TaxID=79674 RepID=UPI0034D715F6
MVNSFGYTLTHPLLPPPYSITRDPSYIDIHKFEQASHVESILDSIIRHTSRSQDSVEEVNSQPCDDITGMEGKFVSCSTVEGVAVKSVGRPSSSDIPGLVKLFNETLQYCWTPINHTDLTIVLVLPQNHSKAYLPLCKGYQPQGLPGFKYHLQPNHSERNCSEKREPSEGFVKFAPDCFLDVMSYIQNENFSISEINDIFSGEKPSQEVMRKDLYGSVKLLRKADQLWREIDICRNQPYVRYMGTADGVFISFPGKSLHQAYDHRNTHWYRRAVSFQQKEFIAMTTPYCSEFGGRTLYTITQTLYDHHDNPVAVVAGDFPAQDILDEFRSNFPFCKKSICILVDSLGYVVLKSDWEHTGRCSNDSTEIVAAHITRVAPDLALDMISKYLLQRRACHDYEENLTFYYWSFALKGKDTVYKASTSMYTVRKITLTSLYLIVRHNGASDRSCNCDPFKKGSSLDCHDTCALECECPCKAGINTIPCHNADHDVHRYPIPACKPLGLTEDLSKCSAVYDLSFCSHNETS